MDNKLLKNITKTLKTLTILYNIVNKLFIKEKYWIYFKLTHYY